MRRSTILVILALLAGVYFTAKWEPPDAAEHFRRGERHARSGRFTDAIASYTRAIELDPDFIEAYRKRAAAHMHLTEYREAIADHNEVLAREPGYARIYYDRGISHYFLKEREEACRDMRIACSLSYRNGCIQVQRGCDPPQTPEAHPAPPPPAPAETPAPPPARQI